MTVKHCLICSLVCIILIGCSKDVDIISDANFYDANAAYENGQLDEAIESYVLFINEIDDDDEPLVQYVYLQLAKIYYSKQLYKQAIYYAENVHIKRLYFETYIIKSTHEMDKYYARDKKMNIELTDIDVYGYSLKDRAKTIIGLSYLNLGSAEEAIESFEDIRRKEDSYYYLAIAYGLLGDKDKEKKYYQKNMKKGNIGLVKTKKWLTLNVH